MARYSITVHTSDVPQSMVDAGGFVVLHGANVSSKEVMLKRQDSATFQSGAQDTWTTSDMQDLGPLQKLTIGLKGAVCLFHNISDFVINTLWQPCHESL